MAERWSSCMLLLSMTMAALHSVHAVVPAIFIFGDSTVDVGTNNYLNNTMANVNFPFYGIDFPGSRPTGRFSNGFNIADFLSKHMGFRRSPSPFLDPVNQRNLRPRNHVINGVNFASGGSGVLNETGEWLIVVPLSEQIQQFTAVHQKLENLLGLEGTDSFLSKSMFFFSVGSNDFFQQYFFNSTLDKEFVNRVINAYEQQLKSLYSLGARKFGIISVPPIGCCPAKRLQNHLQNHKEGCLETLNDYSQLFYSAAETMLQKLGSELKEIKYSLGNTYKMVNDMMANPHEFNMKELQSACCGNGTLNAESECSSSSNLCSHRDEFLFWDWYHPTQAAARLAALTLYGGGTKYVWPINFKQLEDAA